MKKALVILGILGLLAFAVSAQAVTTTSVSLNLYGLVNDFCSPIVPFNPHLLDSGGNIDPTGCFVDWMNDPGLLGGDTLDIFDPVLQNSWSFPLIPSDNPVLLGDGYGAWVVGTQSVVERTLNYSGVDISDTDAYISLPGQPDGTGGVHHIGIPYPVGTAVDWTQIIVTDGTESYTLYNLIYDLGDYKWGSFEFTGLDAASQNAIGIPSGGDPMMQGGSGYWVQTTKSNLALIIPHPI